MNQETADFENIEEIINKQLVNLSDDIGFLLILCEKQNIDYIGSSKAYSYRLERLSEFRDYLIRLTVDYLESHKTEMINRALGEPQK
jgi:hypothetical protein